MDEFKKYLFSYGHNGKQWGFDIPATSEQDARARLAKMQFAHYDGELVLTIPVPAAGWMLRLFRLLRGG